jgi:hypothetical protein
MRSVVALGVLGEGGNWNPAVVTQNVRDDEGVTWRGDEVRREEQVTHNKLNWLGLGFLLACSPLSASDSLTDRQTHKQAVPMAAVFRRNPPAVPALIIKSGLTCLMAI